MATPELDAVLDDLDVVIAESRASESRLGFFAAMYRQMTLEVRRGIEAGAFDDGPRMDRFVATFAGRYLGALRSWQAGGEVSKAWWVAFDAAAGQDRLILQHLVLGINAHINLDLGVTAAQTAAGAAIGELEADFNRVNDTLARLLDPVQEVVARFSPLLGILDAVGGRGDEEVLNFSFRAARDDAWRHAVVLTGQDPAFWAEAIAVIDRKVAFLGRIVSEPGGILGPAVAVVRWSESDDVVAVIDALNTIVAP